MTLMAEGILVPTAQQISGRAGIGIRTFFRHFEDMESLFVFVDGRIRDCYEELFLGGDRTGPLPKRINGLVERRADAYENVTNVWLSTKSQLWRSNVLQRLYARGQRGLRRDLEHWLPELERLSRETREAADAITSFEMWHRLREHQGLGKQASKTIVTQLLQALLSEVLPT
jgi:AcrR family transcriptional regulator